MRIALVLILLSLGILGCGIEDSAGLGGAILGQVKTCDTTNGDITPHWEPGERCIAVSYEPALSPYLGELQAGLLPWSSLACSRLCFSAPEAIERGNEVVPTGWMHFRAISAQGGQFTLAVLHFRQDRGKVLNGVVSVAIDALSDLPLESRAGVWTSAVAQGLGLPTSEGGPSARARTTQDLVAEPTAEDTEVFCGFYGAGGICALLP